MRWFVVPLRSACFRQPEQQSATLLTLCCRRRRACSVRELRELAAAPLRAYVDCCVRASRNEPYLAYWPTVRPMSSATVGSSAAQEVFGNADLVLVISKHLAKTASPRELAYAVCTIRPLRAALASAPCVAIYRERCASSPALVRLVDAADGDFLTLLRRLTLCGVEVEPPRWALSDFTWAIDVRLRGVRVLSYTYNYAAVGRGDHQQVIVPPCSLVAGDFPSHGNTVFRADMYVRRSDGAIARVDSNVKGIEGDEDDEEDDFGDCRVLLHFKADGFLVFTEPLQMANEPDAAEHCIRPVCKFVCLFTANDSLDRDPHDDLPPLRTENMTAAQLNRPVSVDADSAFLPVPLIRITEEFDEWGEGGDEFDEEETLTFLSALKFV